MPKWFSYLFFILTFSASVAIAAENFHYQYYVLWTDIYTIIVGHTGLCVFMTTMLFVLYQTLFHTYPVSTEKHRTTVVSKNNECLWCDSAFQPGDTVIEDPEHNYICGDCIDQNTMTWGPQ